MFSNPTNYIIQELETAIQLLSDNITQAKTTLLNREHVPESIMKRLECYEEMVTKNRTLVASLKEHLQHKNYDEVYRCINLINSISKMIQDDAKEILKELNQNEQ